MVTACSVEKEDLLALTLAIAGSDAGDLHIRKKRKRKIFSGEEKANCLQGFEGKIYTLMRARDEMLKIKEGGNCNQQLKRSRVPLVAAHHHRLGNAGGKDLHLFHLLLITATAVSECNAAVALDNLADLYRSVSLVGDSVQRVVGYFADGLVVRLLRTPDHSSFLDRIMEQPTKEEEFLAFTFMYRASPYYQFEHFTANQAIVEAFEREEKTNNRELHVIDFDVSYGFQWPSLIQSLSEKASLLGSRILFRLTGYGRSKEELRETELRLTSFSKPFANVTFRFKGLLNGSEPVGLRMNKTETLAVNFVFPLGTVNENLKKSETLKLVHSMKPSILVGVEQEIHRSPRSFFSRFMASLHYFAAMFDSLDGCFPAESPERLTIERSLLGKEIMRTTVESDVEEDGGRGFQRYARMETWKGKMEGSGFRETTLSSKCLMQARLLLKIRTQTQSQCCGGSEGFRVVERNEGRALSLAWQDQSLLTVSAWQS